jgi:carboxyl-terminal processing protease
LVQTTFNLDGGAEMRLTISRYYTPSGRSIQKPYEDGDEYDRDIISRYNHGEFFHADSIKFNDSLKYVTQNGRTVYGGGGIMPDYFVSLDTTLNSHYLNELYVSNAINEYTFDYADKHRSELEKMGWENFHKNFAVTDGMLNELVAAGKRAKVNPDYKELKDRKRIFQIHVKAQVARKIWSNEGFFPIFNETNEVFLQAIKMFDKTQELNRQKM